MSNNLPAHPDAERFIEMNKVMEYYIKNTPIITIMKETGLTRKVVEGHISEWRKSAIGGEFLKDRVTELLAVMDEHFSKLIEEVWSTIAQINDEMEFKVTPQLIAQRISALKTAGELDTKRVDMLQKAGLLDAADLGDEIADMEEQHAQIMAILREVSSTCPNCRMEVARRLSDITGKAVPADPDIVEGEVVG